MVWVIRCGHVGGGHKQGRLAVNMWSVEIRELKARLCEYVDEALDDQGMITALRGREVATSAQLDADLAAINALVEAGKARWSGPGADVRLSSSDKRLNAPAAAEGLDIPR